MQIMLKSVHSTELQLNIKRPFLIGGLTPLTTIDFPDHLSTVIFCQGCSWRCAYCHNSHLIPRNIKTEINWQDVQFFLKKRQGFLDGVVFSGGEPLLQRRLPEMIDDLRQMGFDVAMHTTGSVPARFRTVLPKLSWVGFDIKGPFSHYEKITGVAKSEIQALQSLELLLESGVNYEVRTTVDPLILTETDILELAAELSNLGVKHYVLQQCRPIESNVTVHFNTVDLKPDSEIATQLNDLFETFSIRTY